MSTTAPTAIAWWMAAHLLLGVSLAHAGSTGSCMILVRQIDGLPGKQARFWCSKSQGPCRGKMQIESDGQVLTLFIKATSIPGNIYLKFFTRDHDLSVGSDPYLHLAVGGAGKLHETIGVSIASSLAPEDNPSALSHRPILRAPGEILAVLRIDIDLDR